MNQTLRLHCSTCNVALTNPLSFKSNLVIDDLGETDREHRIPAGSCFVAAADDWAADGHYVVNLGDLVNVADHTDSRRLNGCCGLDGLDGVHTVCSNGHEVAIRRTDCWMPHYAAFPPSLVIAGKMSDS